MKENIYSGLLTLKNNIVTDMPCLDTRTLTRRHPGARRGSRSASNSEGDQSRDRADNFLAAVLVTTELISWCWTSGHRPPNFGISLLTLGLGCIDVFVLDPENDDDEVRGQAEVGILVQN